MRIKTQAYFHLVKAGCIPEEKTNVIDFDLGETTFDEEQILKFQNGFYIA
jgi:hypothetical protein